MDELMRILQSSQSLSFLSLIILDSHFPDTNERDTMIPATVSSLSIYFSKTSSSESLKKSESLFVNPMLKSSPQLLHATVFANSLALKPETEVYNFYGESLITNPFIETHVYCADNGIAFKLLETNHPPPFLEHICNSTQVRVDPTQPNQNDLDWDCQWEVNVEGADMFEDEAPDFE